MSSKEYLLLNIVFAALLIGLYVACYFFDSDAITSCKVLELTGRECASCGLTRDFISFVHLNFQNPINQYSIIVFFWFVLQFIVRILLILLPSERRLKAVKYDIIFCVVSGLSVFLQFWI